MPTVHFLLRGDDGLSYYTEWDPQDYLIEIESTYECQVCIYSHTEVDKITLGTSFLTGYYAEFDKDSGVVGLAPNTESSKDELTASTVPTRLRGYSVPIVAGIGSGMAVLVGLFLWMILGIFCYTLKRSSKKTEVTNSIDPKLVEQLTAILDAAKKKDSGSSQILIQ